MIHPTWTETASEPNTEPNVQCFGEKQGLLETPQGQTGLGSKSSTSSHCLCGLELVTQPLWVSSLHFSRGLKVTTSWGSCED